MRVKLVVAIVMGLCALPWLCSSARAEVAIGRPAPALSGVLLDGKPFDLAAQRGKVVIVNFWARWCGPCREEMPVFDSFYRRDKKRGLEVIGISVDHAKHRDDVVGIMRAFGYPSAMLDDVKTNEFGWPDTLPATYIIDRNGVLNALIPPDRTPVKEQDLESILEPLLAAKLAAVDKRP